jgi:hypothetical protein
MSSKGIVLPKIVLDFKGKKENYMKLESYALHKEGKEGWVVIKLMYDEEKNKFSWEKVTSTPNYKIICIEKAKKLMYSLWY